MKILFTEFRLLVLICYAIEARLGVTNFQDLYPSVLVTLRFTNWLSFSYD